MYSKYFILVWALFQLTQSSAQDCHITVNGKVIDEATQIPLSYVNVYIQETQQGTITEEDGSFVLDDVCHGEFHFIFSHLGCEAVKHHYHIDNDTTLTIALSHSPINLGTVVIGGQKENYNNQPNQSIKRQTIEDNSNLNLSGILELESGIHLIKNGSGISKPVVQGLYGNRLAILNNGVQQSGQQWGNDHSPEIDPFSTDKITLIKGASALEYGSGNLGSVILTEPKKIKREPHLHGQANYIFESNGMGHTLNARIAKYSPILAWKINGTLKKYGDRKTPDYFLNNSGAEEANLSLQLEKSWNEHLFFDFHASTFNTQLGILRGSHIGNLTDLEAALTNDVPFFTQPNFSYEIEAPRQQVSHHLIKTKAKYFVNDEDNIEVILAGQINDRKEYDVRRNNLSDTPSLSLLQTTVNAEAKYTKHFKDWKLKLGNQNIITNNNNQPGTGILPLIPNYTSLKSGIYSTLHQSKEKLSYGFGLRYDYENQIVLQLSQSIPREIIRYENNFNNISGLFTIDSKLSKTQSISWNIGFAMRNPAVNELYSNGLHQGVSGIEEGDPELNTEKALKNTIEYKWLPSSNFTFNALAYYQAFDDYIFLDPQDEFRLTIRGSFPVFRYEQAGASIYGLDLSTQFTLGHALLGKLKYSYIRGENREMDIPLVFIPPNNFSASLTYRVHKSIRLSNSLTLDDTEIELTDRLVFRQNNILTEQDFAPTPDGYNLIGFKLSTNLIVPNYKFRFFIKADNLLNTRYRDYLNRQRYFADDMGRSISAGINFKF